MLRPNYETWIARERRIRQRILTNSPVFQVHKRYRICSTCDEILLCHEARCPNCDGSAIAEQPLPDDEVLSPGRYRCRFRWSGLAGNQS
jgi:hypothetical protein